MEESKQTIKQHARAFIEDCDCLKSVMVIDLVRRLESKPIEGDEPVDVEFGRLKLEIKSITVPRVDVLAEGIAAIQARHAPPENRVAELEAELASVKSALATAEKMLAAAHEPTPEAILARAKVLIGDAEDAGLVLTIELKSHEPPAMGNYTMVPDVRPARHAPAAIIGMDMAAGPDIPYIAFAHSNGEVHFIKPPPYIGPERRSAPTENPEDTDPQPPRTEEEKNAQASKLLDAVAKLPPVHTAPYGIHGAKFPGTIWPTPKNTNFNLKDSYDPMNLANREKPLKILDCEDKPRRRRTDRQSED